MSRNSRRLWWEIILAGGLAFTCITPFVNDTWWFARERAAFRAFLDIRRWVFLLGGFLHASFLGHYAKMLEARKKAEKGK